MMLSDDNNVKKEDLSEIAFSTFEIQEAQTISKSFTELYYECMDKKRHIMSKLYQDDAVLSWNGHGIKGNSDIVKFLTELPSCDHDIRLIEGQKILEEFVQNQISYVITVSGNVKYKGSNKAQFHQNFIITAEGSKWKLVNDNFRSQEVPVDLAVKIT